MENVFFKAYLKVYGFIAKDRVIKHDLAERYMHSHLVCVLATGILMWSYAFVAYFTIKNPIPAIVGFTASIIHLASPLLYRLNNKRFLNTNIFLGAGIIHQATFGFFCGGFFSNIIIWFGILPMLAGIVCGRKGILTWLIVSSLVALGFLILEATGFSFPDEISPLGLLISQSLVTFGWIYISAIVVWLCIILIENHQREIETKNSRIQNLICVISHDISTPLSVIIGRTSMLKRTELPEVAIKSLEKIYTAGDNITHIINNVRNLYATEMGKIEIPKAIVNVNKLLIQLHNNFSEKLEDKKINLVIHNKEENLEIMTNADLLLHQILGNILSNAIKFSPEESSINITLEKLSGVSTISIADSGIGIPDNLLLNIFHLRGQTSRVGTYGEKGTGFGLPIVKTYTEQLGGKISVISKIKNDDLNQRGTTFILEFLD